MFLARKAAWALSRRVTTDGADYCMLIDEWVWSKSRVCLLRLEVDIDSVLESELGQKWVKCICMLKAISSEQKSRI